METKTKKTNKVQHLANLAFGGYVLIVLVLGILSEIPSINLPRLDYIFLLAIPIWAFYPPYSYKSKIPSLRLRNILFFYTVLVWILILVFNLLKFFSIYYDYLNLVTKLLLPIVAVYAYVLIKHEKPKLFDSFTKDSILACHLERRDHDHQS
jgi:uncharacterized membrane protein